jgi:hypothetical protein
MDRQRPPQSEIFATALEPISQIARIFCWLGPSNWLGACADGRPLIVLLCQTLIGCRRNLKFCVGFYLPVRLSVIGTIGANRPAEILGIYSASCGAYASTPL